MKSSSWFINRLYKADSWFTWLSWQGERGVQSFDLDGVGSIPVIPLMQITFVDHFNKLVNQNDYDDDDDDDDDDGDGDVPLLCNCQAMPAVTMIGPSIPASAGGTDQDLARTQFPRN